MIFTQLKRGRPPKGENVTNLAIEIGKRLKKAREDKHLTQEEMGATLGIGRAGYANIETGRSLLQVDHLMKLPQILQKPVSYFLAVENDLTPAEAELLQLYRAIPPGIGRDMVMDIVNGIVDRFKKYGGKA